VGGLNGRCYQPWTTKANKKILQKLTFPETNIAPENGCGRLFSFWKGPFSWAMLVLERVNLNMNAWGTRSPF